EDACEKGGMRSCLAKLTAAVTNLQKMARGACACVNASNLGARIEADFDAMSGVVYCDPTSGTPLGGDDAGVVHAGYIPPSATRACENHVNKLVGKTVACIIGCHVKRARATRGAFTSDTGEDACEKNATNSCRAKFIASVGRLSGCPACLSGNAPG